MEYSETAVLRVAVSFALLASLRKGELAWARCCGEGRENRLESSMLRENGMRYRRSSRKNRKIERGIWL